MAFQGAEGFADDLVFVRATTRGRKALHKIGQSWWEGDGHGKEHSRTEEAQGGRSGEE
jgi:hypothetical protein